MLALAEPPGSGPAQLHRWAKANRSQRLQRIVAQIMGFTLLVPTLLFVLGFTSQRWTFDDPCDVPEAESEALFDYMSFWTCAQVLPLPAKVVLLVVWLILLISLLASTADNFFVPQLEEMSRRLGLPEDVAGVTLLALGNGMPDVMTATSSINKADDFALTMGEFLGAAGFIVGLVLGCVLLTKQGPTRVDACAFMRDSIAYSIVLVFMLIVTWDGSVDLFESLSFFGVYLLYVAIVVLPSRFKRPARAIASLQEESQALSPEKGVQEADEEMVSIASTGEPADGEIGMDPSPTGTVESDSMEFVLLESDTEGPEEDDDLLEGFSDAEGPLSWVQLVMELPFTVVRHASIPAANWNRKRRRLAAMCPLFSSLVLLLSFGGWSAFSKYFGPLPMWVCSVIFGLICALAILQGSSPDRAPRWHGLLLLLAFLCTVGWFNLFANECVAVLETFGLKFGVSSSVLGITVLAWGNSVGDLVADTALVKKGKSKMAVSGCFGSPLLSDLLGLGVALTSYTLSVGPLQASLSTQNKIAAAFTAFAILTSIVVFAVNRFSAPRWLGWVLLAEYAALMVVSVLLEMGVFLPKD